MSIRIDKITCGRFGNKVFQYNNLVQLGNLLNTEVSCCRWEGNDYFKNIVSYKPSKKKRKILMWNEILNNDITQIKNMLKTNDLCFDDPSLALHNTFYKLTKRNPRDYLELKDKYIPKQSDNFIYVGIHIRGGDILGKDNGDGREIHTPSYYKKSIDYLLEQEIDKEYIFTICTDDPSFESTKETINYLNKKKCKYVLGPDYGKRTFINDFAKLCYSDILINSSSTFCLAATFLGKQKKIIHNIDWMNRVVRGDFSNQEYKKYIRVLTNRMTDVEWRTTMGYNKAKIFWTELNENSYFNVVKFI